MGSIVHAKPAWEDVVREKRRARAEAIESFEQRQDKCTLKDVSMKVGRDVISASAGDVVRAVTGGTVSCQDIIASHINEVCRVHEATNCLSEICFDDALICAKELDDHLRQHGTSKGPLHGLPTTLKDQFNIKGYDTTLGYVGRALSPAEDDAALVKMLRALGAVIMAKTNLPQSIMWCETENPLWGLTSSTFDPGYTPGGSTGGEAVLIAKGASKLGFGTDLGGSIRIPAHLMGIYGLRPSHARLPYEGAPVSTEGQEHVPSSVGPMAASLDTIHLTTKSLIDLQPWTFDARYLPIPWREDHYTDAQSRPLVLGVLRDDGIARPHPPLTRVLDHAVDLLRTAGHEMVEWDASLHAECVQLMDEYYTADGGEDIRSAVQVGGEPFIPHVEKLVGRGSAISVSDYWQLNKRKWALQNAYMRKWDSVRGRDGRVVDAVIMPPMSHVAVPHGNTRWVGYTKVWNVLDYTALVIPGGYVGKEDVEAPWAYEPRGEVDEWSLDLWKYKEDMARLKLPVGIQIVGRKLEEEKVLGIGKVLEDLLRAGNA